MMHVFLHHLLLLLQLPSNDRGNMDAAAFLITPAVLPTLTPTTSLTALETTIRLIIIIKSHITDRSYSN